MAISCRALVMQATVFLVLNKPLRPIKNAGKTGIFCFWQYFLAILIA
jgi:hypothetical protein